MLRYLRSLPVISFALLAVTVSAQVNLGTQVKGQLPQANIAPPTLFNEQNLADPNSTNGITQPPFLQDVSWTKTQAGILPRGATGSWNECMVGLGNTPTWRDPETGYLVKFSVGANTKSGGVCNTSFSGGDQVGHEQLGCWYQVPNSPTWTECPNNPILPVSSVSGDPDSGGISDFTFVKLGKNQYKANAICTQVAGFENGNQSACGYSFASLNPLTLSAASFTRLGIEISYLDVPWTAGGPNRQIYHMGKVMVNGGICHAFFNAGTDVGQEDVGHATSPTCGRPWAIDSYKTICRQGVSGACSSGSPFPTASALADPNVFHAGHQWFMSGWLTGFADWMMYIDDTDFPGDSTHHWKPVGVNTNSSPVVRATWQDRDGHIVITGQDAGSGSIDPQVSEFTVDRPSESWRGCDICSDGSHAGTFTSYNPLGTDIDLYNNNGGSIASFSLRAGSVPGNHAFVGVYDKSLHQLAWRMATSGLYAGSDSMLSTSARCWSTSTTTADAPDTCIWRPATGKIYFGDATPNDSSAELFFLNAHIQGWIPTLTTAPTGSCTPVGALVVSLDGHGTSCGVGGTWVSRW